MMSKIKNYFCLFIIFAVINGCFHHNKKNIPDIDTKNVRINFYRFDTEFHRLSAENYDSLFAVLNQKYGDFLFDYSGRMMGFDTKDSQTLKKDILDFNNDTIVNNIFADIEKQFKIGSDYEKDLQSAIGYYQHYFPKKQITEVLSIASMLRTNERGNGAMAYGDTTLVVALDMYLGRQYEKYVLADFPEYLIKKFSPEYIAPNCMEVLYMNNFGTNTSEYTNLQAMVDAGKMLYFMEYMLPEADDTLLIGYSKEQLKWCKDSEKQIWKFLNEKDLLLKNNYNEQKRLVGDAPTTTGMPPESPGKVGAWVGWQIVRKFAAENPSVSFQELIEKTSPQTIIDRAKYKP